MLQILGTAAVTVAVWIASAVATYNVAIWIHPARTADGAHVVMPIAQVAWAILVATPLALGVVVLAVRRHLRRRRALAAAAA